MYVMYGYDVELELGCWRSEDGSFDLFSPNGFSLFHPKKGRKKDEERVQKRSDSGEGLGSGKWG